MIWKWTQDRQRRVFLSIHNIILYVENFVLTFSLEEYRDGYPRFCTLISANTHFFIYRQFLRLRSRHLLLKQDKLCLLKQQLDDLDKNKTGRLFLRKTCSDRNIAYSSLHSEIYL